MDDRTAHRASQAERKIEEKQTDTVRNANKASGAQNIIWRRPRANGGAKGNRETNWLLRQPTLSPGHVRPEFYEAVIRLSCPLRQMAKIGSTSLSFASDSFLALGRVTRLEGCKSLGNLDAF